MGEGNPNRRRTEQNMDNKQRGWDNRDARQDRRPQQRASFDPAKVKVIGEAGRFPLDKNNSKFLVVEYTSYDGGARQVQIRKTGKDQDGAEFSTFNIGRLWPDTVEQLSKLLAKAALEMSAEKKAYDSSR